MNKISFNTRTDYGFLFKSMNSSKSGGNVLGGVNLSDYADIKSGSYGKLLKSYYAKQKLEESQALEKKKNLLKRKKENKKSDDAKVLEKKSDTTKVEVKKKQNSGYTSSGKYSKNYAAGDILNSII